MTDTPPDPILPEPTTPSPPAPEPASADALQSLSLEFAPSWARQTSSTNRYETHSGEDRKSRSKSGRYDDKRARRDAPRLPRPIRRDGDRGERRDPREGDRGRDDRPFQRHEPLPLDIGFVPGQKAVSQIAKQIRSTCRAYPLMHVAAYLLGNAAYYMVRLQYRKDATDHFHQCRICKAVATNEATIVRHLLVKHIAELAEVKEEEGEAYTGEFSCVAQCGISGVILGPPNHHSYAEKVREIHATRFFGMPMEEYRTRIKMVHDKALVDQWKEESRKRRSYVIKNGENSSELKHWSDVEQHILQHRRKELIETTRRAVIPATVAVEMEDPDLQGMMRSAYRRESQFPLRMSLALRASLRHMGFPLFRIDREKVFVAPVEPMAIDATNAIPAVQHIVAHLTANPRTRREALLTHCQSLPDADAATITSTLTWLIQKGHIIELADTALLLPSDAGFTRGEPEQAEAEEEIAAVAAPDESDPLTVEDSAPLEAPVIDTPSTPPTSEA